MDFIEKYIPDTPCKLFYFNKIGLFDLMKKKLVLDVGCGTGYFSYLISKKAKKVWGIDIVKENIDFCKEMKIIGEFLVADAKKLPFAKNFFGFVFCSEVLEHLGNYKRGLEEIDRVLAPKGYVLLTFPIRPKFFVTRWLYEITDSFNRWYYGKKHPQVHKEKIKIEEVVMYLKDKGYKIVKKEGIRNTMATFICELFILLEKFIRIIRFGGRGRDFQLASQKNNLKLPIVRLWRMLGMPLVGLFMKIDGLFNGFDSSCGVVLAKKR